MCPHFEQSCAVFLLVILPPGNFQRNWPLKYRVLRHFGAFLDFLTAELAQLLLLVVVHGKYASPRHKGVSGGVFQRVYSRVDRSEV